ncbi:MAG: Integral membrane protein MviN [Parcubacteria group bacterium GW2011_GWC2_39_14]|nr:MAG: Integral membrane protein MviN [Parcubacteria group bacterium GW2011_GWC2_39_14]KKR53361.1 MAG: Integral membrane protein MviN [Parcubacteria group bacterium GW2011_GWA2_40_23]
MIFDKLLSKKASSVATAAVVIAIAGLLSRVLGIVRDRVLAGQFGAGNELDIYYAAFRIPDLLINLIALGALSAGFIPIFIGLIKKEDDPNSPANKEAWSFVSNIINIIGVILVFFGGILAVLSPWLVPLMTPGFSGEKLSMTITLTQILFLSPFILGISSILGGVLQSFRQFLAFSLAPVMYNIGIIIGAKFFVQYWGLYGLAYGVILGAVLHLLIQLPGLIRLGWRPCWIFKPREKSFVQVLKLIGPRILGLASGQVNFIVITVLASTIAAGSLAIFNLANNLQSFPVSFFGVSFALAVFPLLSRHFASGKEDEFQKSFLSTFKQILLFTIPFTALFIILRIQIVRVVLGAGKFNWTDTVLTADTLGILCLSLFAQALLPLLVRVFYARHNTLLPFWSSFISMLVNLALSWYLIKVWGVMGLAFGFTISQLVNVALLIVFLKFKVKDIWHDGLLSFSFKLTFAALIMGFVTQVTKTAVGTYVDMDRFWGVLTQGFVAGLVGLIVFIILAYAFKVEELIVFVASMKRKLLVKFRSDKETIIDEDLT